MEAFPKIYTTNLELRKLTVDDVPSLVKHANNKKIAAHILNMPFPYEEHNAVFRLSYVYQGFKNNTHYVFAIISRESDEFVGEISLHLGPAAGIAQLAYWIAEPFWNRGIATEAAKAVTQFGFNKLKLEWIYAECHMDNPASQQVLVHVGMERKKVTGNVAQYIISAQMPAAI